MGNTESGINQLRQAEPTKAVESEVYLEWGEAINQYDNVFFFLLLVDAK